MSENNLLTASRSLPINNTDNIITSPTIVHTKCSNYRMFLKQQIIDQFRVDFSLTRDRGHFLISGIVVSVEIKISFKQRLKVEINL